EARRDEQRVGRVGAELHLPAIAALPEPLGQAEHEVESQLVGADRALGVVVEAPRRAAAPRGWAPRALLQGEEQAEDEPVTGGALEWREAVRLRKVGRGAEPQRLARADERESSVPTNVVDDLEHARVQSGKFDPEFRRQPAVVYQIVAGVLAAALL